MSFSAGHGSTGDADQLRARIDLDRVYVHGLRGDLAVSDPRLDPSAMHGAWLPGAHEWQRKQLTQRAARDGTPG
jgi:hypothetical protein